MILDHFEDHPKKEGGVEIPVLGYKKELLCVDEDRMRMKVD